MRSLKILVVVMGLLLVAGGAALIAGIVWRVNHGPIRLPTVVGPHDTAIDLPPGAVIEATDIAGDRMVLRLGLPGGNKEMLIIDLRSGTRIATIDLKASDPKASPGSETRP